MSCVRLKLTIIVSDKAAIFERDRGRCVKCGREVSDAWPGYSVHHRLLRSGGRDDRLCNLILACGSGTFGCHGHMHANPREARDAGWIVSKYGRPEEMPVLYHDQGFMLLTVDGGLATWPAA